MIATAGPVIVMAQEELAALIAAAADAAIERYVKAYPNTGKLRPPAVTQSDAAKMLGKSRPTIGKMVKAGTFRMNKLGMIPIEQIDSALRQS